MFLKAWGENHERKQKQELRGKGKRTGVEKKKEFEEGNRRGIQEQRRSRKKRPLTKDAGKGKVKETPGNTGREAYRTGK